MWHSAYVRANGSGLPFPRLNMPNDPRGVAFQKRTAVDALRSESSGDDDGIDVAQAPDTDEDSYDCTCPSCGHEFAVSLDDLENGGDGTDAVAATSDQLPEMAGGGNDDTGAGSDEMGFRMGGGRS